MNPYLYQDLTYKLRGIFFEVYNELGPGLSEIVYQRAIVKELVESEIPFKEEVRVIIKYKEEKIGLQKIDLLIDNKVIVEIKATEKMHPLFEMQTRAYLKATGYKLALLVNFGGEKIIIKRYVN